MTPEQLLGVLLWNIAAGVTVAATATAWFVLLVQRSSSATAAERARKRGELVYDLEDEEFVEIDPLDCRSSTIKIGDDSTVSCANCGETR